MCPLFSWKWESTQTGMVSWIFKISRRFQLNDNSLHRAWHNGGCRKLGVMGQGWGGWGAGGCWGLWAPHAGSSTASCLQCSFLLAQVETDSKLTLNWDKITLQRPKLNSKSMYMLVQQHHCQSINKTTKNGRYISIDRSWTRSKLPSYTTLGN